MVLRTHLETIDKFYVLEKGMRESKSKSASEIRKKMMCEPEI
jgi:hypothetical protein